MEWLLLLVGALTGAMAAGLVFREREKRLLRRLQSMIDAAAAGRSEAGAADESMESLLANSLRQFLQKSHLTEQRMQEQKGQIQQLISDISHQSITPISNIFLYTQLLEERDQQGTYREEISSIKEQMEKLDFLINSMVKSSRLETGSIAVQGRKNQVEELIDSAMQQVLPLAEEKQVQITAEKTDAAAVFDMKWTIEALFNVLENGVKYTPQGGIITIDTVPYNLFVRINVTDTGIGIAEEEHSRIFSRFYRSESVHDEKGVGIGLYLVQKILTLQGGYVKLTSAPGEGSQFSLFLPTAETEMSHNCDI